MATRTVTAPYPNRSKRVGRDGRYPTSVTVRQDSIVETHSFYDPADAEALRAKAVRAGFKEV